MKRFYIILLIIFISFISISNLKADQVQPRYVATINNCYAYAVSDANSGLSSNNDYSVLVYEVVDNISTYTFQVISGTQYRIDIFSSNTLNTDTCSTTMNDRHKVFRYSNFSSYNDYNITVNDKYFYVTTQGAVIEWQGTSSSSTPEPEPEPTYEIPHITILDHDFYLFYDFNTIINFDILEDYTFTSFTDYEKLVITLLFNVFYILFIFIIIYILLKTLNKLLSWVFP